MGDNLVDKKQLTHALFRQCISSIEHTSNVDVGKMFIMYDITRRDYWCFMYAAIDYNRVKVVEYLIKLKNFFEESEMEDMKTRAQFARSTHDVSIFLRNLKL